jgi:hypothetical protein
VWARLHLDHACSFSHWKCTGDEWAIPFLSEWMLLCYIRMQGI